MCGLTRDTIDELCDEFELRWTSECWGAMAIERFLNSCKPPVPDDPRLLTALVWSDLERAWMNWDQTLVTQATLLSPEELCSRLEQLPKMAMYVNVLGPIESNNDSWKEIAERESIARDHWGDAIGYKYYQCRYGIDVPPNKLHVPRRMRVQFEWIRSSTDTPVYPLRGLTRIGRQRSTDLSDSSCETLADGNRIVIANRTETSISRDQITVQLLSSNFAIVTNVSTGGVENSEAGLDPGEQRVLTFPFAVRLPGRLLLFE